MQADVIVGGGGFGGGGSGGGEGDFPTKMSI